MKIYKIASTTKELINWGAQIENGKVILYRGTNIPNLSEKDLRYGDYLSSVNEGNDITGNEGASGYGKYVVEYKLNPQDVKITNGEFQYIGESKSLVGKKYPKEIYKAYNGYYPLLYRVLSQPIAPNYPITIYPTDHYMYS
jgi:hypothetical protein